MTRAERLRANLEERVFGPVARFSIEPGIENDEWFFIFAHIPVRLPLAGNRVIRVCLLATQDRLQAVDAAREVGLPFVILEKSSASDCEREIQQTISYAKKT